MRPLTVSDDDSAHRMRVRRSVSYKRVSWGVPDAIGLLQGILFGSDPCC